MRVLVTGSTSMQTNAESHRRSANFMGLVWETLRAGRGNEAFWVEPSLRWTEQDLDRYDHVVVGLAPPLAMGANRIYGALSVIQHLWDSKRLTLVVDAPDPNLITRGLKAVLANWPSFTKPFFSARREYELAQTPEANVRLHLAVRHLALRQWPRTMAPGLPWSDPRAITEHLPPGAFGRVRTVNLDHLLLSRFAPERTGVTKLREWAYEGPDDLRWLQGLNLGLPARELPANHRRETDSLAVQQLREATGLLAAPVRGIPWWTPKVAMALSQLTPVFTDWRQSQLLGPEWAGLPASHEALPPAEAAEVANEQYVSYARSIPSPSEALGALCDAAGMPARAKRMYAS